MDDVTEEEFKELEEDIAELISPKQKTNSETNDKQNEVTFDESDDGQTRVYFNGNERRSRYSIEDTEQGTKYVVYRIKTTGEEELVEQEFESPERAMKYAVYLAL